MELFFEKQMKSDYKVDCKGLIIAPGYIDIHLNGKPVQTSCKSAEVQTPTVHWVFMSTCRTF